MANPANVPYIGTPTVGVDATLGFSIGQQTLEVQPGMLSHDAVSSPMMSFLQNMPGRLKPTSQEDFYWNEIQIDHPSFACDAGAAGGGTTIVVKLDYPAIIPGQMLSERVTNQYFICNSVTYTDGGTTSTCTLQLPAGTTIATIPANTQFIDCAPAMIEGGDYLASVTRSPETFSGTTTTKSVSVEITTQKALSPQYWGMAWDLDKLGQSTAIKKGIERDFLNSQFNNVTGYTQAAPTATKSGNLRTTRGLLQSIVSNTFSAPQSGTITQQVLYNFFQYGMWPNQYVGSAIKLLLVGAGTAADMSQWMTSFYRTEIIGNQMFGINVTGLKWTDKVAIVMQEPQFYQTAGLYHGALGIDPDKIFARQYGDNLFEMINTSQPQSSTHSMAIVSMLGLETQFEFAHSALYNFN